MDEQTALVLALQMVALFSIAGALLLYLICKIQGNNNANLQSVIPAKSILVTSADCSLGLQLALHLANHGFRVFAGLRDTSDTALSCRILRAWQKNRETVPIPFSGSLIVLPLDVTREDLLHEAVDLVQAHLPAGEDGIWAVLNTSTVLYRGRLEQQDIGQWEAMWRTNVIGVLRVARTFQKLLRNNKGRILNFGHQQQQQDFIQSGLVAYTATKYGVEGATVALQQEFHTHGIDVITLRPAGICNSELAATPKLIGDPIGGNLSIDFTTGCVDYKPLVLTRSGLEAVEKALMEQPAKKYYTVPNRDVWFKRILNK